MKLDAKEMLKNKSDKMIDLIFDDIGPKGEKTLTSTFTDKGVKYLMQLTIVSGDPDDSIQTTDIQAIKDKIAIIEAKLATFEQTDELNDAPDDTPNDSEETL